MFFYLNPECYLITGKKHGAVYDLITGNIYTIPEDYMPALALAELGTAVTEISATAELPQENLRALFDELAGQGLGRYYPKQTFIQKLRVGSLLQDESRGAPELTQFTIELAADCTENCWYCSDTHYQTAGCGTCHQWKNDQGQELSVEEWQRVLDQLAEVGYHSGFFAAGNIRAHWAKVEVVLRYAREHFKEVFIKVPPRSVEPGLLQQLEQLGVTPVVTMDAEEGQALIPAQMAALQTLKQPFRVMLNTRTEENPLIPEVSKQIRTIQETATIQLNFIGESAVDLKNIARVAGYNRLQKVSPQSFVNSLSKNACLYGALAITPAGNILPCVMMPERVVGNVQQNSIRDLISTKEHQTDDSRRFTRLSEFWFLTRDKIEGCRECENRYGCYDCRATEDDLGKTTLCHYDLCAGEWRG